MLNSFAISCTRVSWNHRHDLIYTELFLNLTWTLKKQSYCDIRVKLIQINIASICRFLLVCILEFNLHPDCLVSALDDTSCSKALGFPSEHSLSYYLMKHPRDALEVIGFSTRGKGHRAEFACVFVHELSSRKDMCVCSCCYTDCTPVLCLCWVQPMCFGFSVNHCVFGKVCR